MIYLSKDLQPGDLLSAENLCIVRPGDGLTPKYYQALLCKVVTKDAIRVTPVNWGLAWNLI